MILHDVVNLLTASLWYTAGIVVVGLFLMALYLTIDLLTQFIGGK